MRMNKSIIINLGSGNLEEGFTRVTAQLRADESAFPEQYIGSLPPAPLLIESYRDWQLHYQTLCNRRQLSLRVFAEQDDELVIFEEGITNVSQASFDEVCQRLDEAINVWLKSPSFLNIELQMRSQFSLNEEIHVIIESNDELIRRLPWHCWNFFRDYPKANVAFAQPEYKRPDKFSRTRLKREYVRVLAVLGNHCDIDLEVERQFLDSFEDAEVQFLVNPTRENFNLQLWDSIGWDVLFFAGHSQTEGETGRIYLNEETTNNSLTVDKLSEALKTAIERGLQLAIFNSCDGIGLGLALERLNIPVGIVMREAVPNRVAQEFFKFFLDAFAKKGLSLQLSVQYARRQLQGLEGDFPGASWLPALCINPSVKPPMWKQMRDGLPCPYQEWSTFMTADTQLFFGRTSFIQQLITAIKTKSLVALIGASRSGKSSLIQAGLIPQLSIKSATWQPTILSFCPEDRPFAKLADTLFAISGNTLFREVNELETELRQNPEALCQQIHQLIRQQSGTRILLVIDQLETIYTLPEEERQSFLDVLSQTVVYAVEHSTNFTLLFTLRASFYNLLAEHPLGQRIEENMHYLDPMSREELKQVIEFPAAIRKTHLESGLTGQLIEAVWDQPGHLALLEFTLAQLWSRQNNRLLTHAAYIELGGVSSLLAHHAEEVYGQLSPDEKLQAKQVFMQLVHPQEKNLPVRQIVTYQEGNSENWNLINHLASQHLVVTNYDVARGTATVEIAHDALMWSWQRLEQWILEDDVFLQWKSQLENAVELWEKSDRGEEVLWRGNLLAASKYWQRNRLEDLTDEEKEFLQQSNLVAYREDILSHRNALQSASPKEFALSPDFVEHCQTILAEFIGPIAPLLCEQILDQFPQVSEQQFVDLLSEKLPNARDINRFKSAVFRFL
jgi:hypothetical protein